MKQKIIIITLALSLLVLAACDGNTTAPTTSGFVGGTKGVELEFSQSAPPEKVSDGGQEPFHVTVELTNQGEHEVLKENVFVRLSGFLASEFGLTNEDLTIHPDEDLIPTSKTADGIIIDAPTIYIDFPEFNYKSQAIGNLVYPMRAEVCYKYETLAISDICVKQNFNRDLAEDVCKVSGIRTVSNAGAPIQVTQVRQSPEGGDRTVLSFSIRNMHTGTALKPDSKCDSQLAINKNRIFVSVVGNNPEDVIVCRGLTEGNSASGYLILSEGIPKDVSCSIKVSDRTIPGIRPIRITLAYDYSIYMQKSVEVIHSPIY